MRNLLLTTALLTLAACPGTSDEEVVTSGTSPGPASQPEPRPAEPEPGSETSGGADEVAISCEAELAACQAAK